MSCFLKGVNFCEITNILLSIIVVYITIKTYFSSKNKNIYENNFKFNYKDLFNFKYNSNCFIDYESRSNGYNIINIIDFIESLYVFNKKSNKFNGVFTNSHYKYLFKIANKLCNEVEIKEVYDYILFDDSDKIIDFYNNKKDLFISFERAYKKFYMSI